MLTEVFRGSLRHVPADEINRRLKIIDHRADFTPAQGLALAASAIHVGADVAIDLGTGLGNSAATLATVCGRVHTFDMDDKWKRITGPRLAAAGIGIGNVIPHVGDMTKVDFGPIVRDARSVALFWDAHGFDIAEHVLAHILPLIANKNHVVVCHDISDNRYAPQTSYHGKRLWRGMADYYARPDDFAYVTLGWTVGNVDQIIAILDFCARNGLDLHSFDRAYDELSPAEKSETGKAFGAASRPFFRNYVADATTAQNCRRSGHRFRQPTWEARLFGPF